jgi:tRNA 2-thiouridine synthesizing protein A
MLDPINELSPKPRGAVTNTEKEMSQVNVDMELDCRGMACPIPILKTKKAIDSMGSGQVLKMISTDPGSVNDVNAWSRRTGNPLVDSDQSDSEYTFYLQKK